MSKNISKLSGRKGLKDNLFKRMIDTTTKSKNGEEIKQLAEEYHVGTSTIHGAESFYEFLRPEHKKKKAWICNGSACMCAGTQDKVRKKLSEKLGKDKIGMMFCLGHCYETNSFHYNGHNYSGNDIDQIDEIIKGKKINSKKMNSKSFATKTILMSDDLSSIEKFKKLLLDVLKKDKKETLKTVTDSNLCGRGGAGFPTGMKWNFCSQQKVEKKYVVCNADEGDSGAFSDRYILEEQPLKVIFGMVVCAYIIGSDEGVLYIRGEYPKSIEIINGAINELKKANLLGKNILGTNFSCDMTICIGQGAYICGEETALIASIEGRRAEVDVRPPFPTVEGLYKKPTVVNNVETLAAIPCILKCLLR
jgi:NADH-quinone oxidoreductase subunit F